MSAVGGRFPRSQLTMAGAAIALAVVTVGSLGIASSDELLRSRSSTER